MKKIFLSLMMLFGAFAVLEASADNIPVDKARNIAEHFFGISSTRSAGTLTLKWDGSAVQTRSDASQPAFYVFDNPAGGFVVVAGDNLVEPVLGYSSEGEFRFDNMPDNVRYWFDYLQRGVDHLRASGRTQSAAVKAKWEAFEKGGSIAPITRAEGGKLLETAKWNQYGPFNLKASQYLNFGQPVYTGCVATAMSIIMYYHKWPERGTGTLESYSYTDERRRSREVQGYELGHAYDWDNMKPRYSEYLYTTDASSSPDSAESQNAVAQLMLDCGVMVKMQYGTYDTGGSGAYDKDVVKMHEHMGYDKSMYFIYKDFYSNATWTDLLINNIDNCGPVYFSASGRSGGHAFVVDGYNAEHQIHINWGWGGVDNGYYTVPDFDEFTDGQMALLDIKPDEGGSLPDPVIVLGAHNWGGTTGTVNGLAFISEPAISAPGEMSMSIKTGILYNISPMPFAGYIYVCHTDKDDNVKAVVKHSEMVDSPLETYYGIGWPNIPYTLKTKDLEPGDKIKCFYEVEGRNRALPVLYSEDVCGELSLDFSDLLEASTSLTFDRQKRVVTVKSDLMTDWALKSASGENKSSAVKASDGVLTIDASSFSGSYTLTVKSEIATKNLELVF